MSIQRVRNTFSKNYSTSFLYTDFDNYAYRWKRVSLGKSTSVPAGGSKHGRRTFGISFEDCYARKFRVLSAICVDLN